MDSWGLETTVLAVGIGLYALVCILCGVLLFTKRYLLLWLWPAALYFCGPMITSIFADVPVLKNYVFPETVVAEMVMMFAYVAFFAVVDFAFGVSREIGSSFNGRWIPKIAESPLFLPAYFLISTVAAALQIVVMIQYGSVFSGSYVTSSNALIPFWGFLAGLYELIFLCFVIFLLSGYRSKFRLLVIAVYVVTAVLRVAGGTRLILIKELAVICILLYMRGKMKPARLILVATIIVVAGSIIGFFRANGQVGNNGFGPLYGAAMESALDALTLNVAYQVNESGYVEEHGDFFEALEFTALSAIPSFLRVGITQPDIDEMSPYNQALSQFDGSAPVGGMSGFGTLCYLSGYPMLSTLTLVLFLSLAIIVGRPGAIKDVIVVVMSISAIHFWRDPIDIAVKNVVQDVICGLAFVYVPAAFKAFKSGSFRALPAGSAVK